MLTNPAGMTRLEGTQFLASGQIDYGRTGFSRGPGTSPGLKTLLSNQGLLESSLDTNLQSDPPVALGGHGDLVGSYENTGTLFIAGYYDWTF